MKRLGITITIVCISVSSLSAQILKPVKWTYGSKVTGKDEATIFIKATIDEGWHIYSQIETDGPIKTSIAFKSSPDYEVLGATIEPAPIKKFEKTFNMEVQYFEKSVVFQQKFKLKGNTPLVVSGTIEYMVCNDEKCLPPDEVEFSVSVK